MIPTINKFTFLGTTFDVDWEIVKRHLLTLCAFSLIIKGIIFALTSFTGILDYFDLTNYGNYMNLMGNLGAIPYTNISLNISTHFPLILDIEYPALFIVLLFVVMFFSAMFGSIAVAGFIFWFQIFSVLFDVLTVIVIYLIVMKLYNEKQAYTISLLYLGAFTSFYFILSKYDALPTLLMMASIMFTLYNKRDYGYICCIAGFFAKIFPILILPLLVIYNYNRGVSFKDDIMYIVKISAVFGAILILPLLYITHYNLDVLKPYLFVIWSGSDVYASGVYANSFVYAIGQIIPIPLTAISTMFTIIKVALALAILVMFKLKSDDINLINSSLLIILTFIVFSGFHSPQYIVWFTPLLVMSGIGIVYFIMTQVLVFIEFLIAFGSLYTNVNYLSPFALILFLVINFVYIYIMYKIYNKIINT